MSLRYPKIRFAVALPCIMLLAFPGAVARGSASDAYVFVLEPPAPPKKSASLGLPLPPAAKSSAPAMVQVHDNHPTAQVDLPQPKQFPAPPKEVNPFILKMVEPTATLDLTVGSSKVLVFKEAPKRIQMGLDEKSAVFIPTPITPTELSLTGKKTGHDVLNLWFADPKDATKTILYTYVVRVAADPNAQLRVREQLDKYYQQLEKEINHAFPDSRVALSIVGSKLLVCGQAHDINEAAQIMRIVSTRSGGQRTTQAKGQTTIIEHGLGKSTITKLPEEDPEDDGQGDAVNPLARVNLDVINMLRVPGEQQVMLKVVVAEVNRSALRNMGINFSVSNGQGLVFANQTGGIIPSVASGVGGTSTIGTGNLGARLDAGKIILAIDALKRRGLARTLAEPSLVALNGHTANFVAGGRFPVPEVTGFTSAGLQGTKFEPFGVQLQFTPVVTDKDRIRLTVSGDISVIDESLSANVAGTNVKGLNSRAFQTVVDLRGGETMAIAGLLNNAYKANSSRVPFLGDLPFIGRLIGGKDTTSADQQELVVLVTPVLARPLDPHYTRPVPGSDMFEPSDAEFYLRGRLESHRPIDYNSPIRTDLRRMQQYRQEVLAPPGNPHAAPPVPPMNSHQYIPPRGNVP